MSKKFFITTPIYYSNGIPHIGHAYSSLIADVLARYHRLQGTDVKFLTGVDENSQKVVESAAEKGMETMEYADMMAAEHQKVWDGLGISYTSFVRTSTPEHAAFVQKMLQRSFDNGDIYEGRYEGLYCVGCEGFKKESDLVLDVRETSDTFQVKMKALTESYEKLVDHTERQEEVQKEMDQLIDAHKGRWICPDHPNKPLQVLSEKNYFFRLSNYQKKLEELYDSHPDFITPSNRFAEIREFVKGGLEDFSISRETNKFGIPLPFDSTQVTYVWYDALFNYLSYAQDDEPKWWPADIHVIGKDIARFHAVYWPAMLWSAGYELPTQLLVTGHFTANGQKISKSIGNVIDPVLWSKKYSRDALTLYLFTAFPIGQDGDFDEGEAILQYNAKLSNNLGNLLNRVLTLSLKLDGTLSGYEESEIAGARDDYQSKYVWHMKTYDLKNALDESFAFATELNQYIDRMKPWKMDTTSPADHESLDKCLSTVAVGLAFLAYNLSPFFETKMKEMLSRLGVGHGWELHHGFQIAEK